MITRLRKTPVILCALLCWLAMTTQAQSSAPIEVKPEPISQENQQEQKKTTQDSETKKTDPQRQRIVDPATMPKPDPKTNKPPGSTLDRGITRFENSKALEKLKVYFSHPIVHPRFGGIGDGSGFGLGVEFTNNVSKSPNLKLSALLHGTFRRYLLTSAGISVDPTRGGRERFQLDFTGRYQLRPREQFYGLGPDSLRSNRSNYNLQERGFNFASVFKPTKSLRLGAGLDFSSTRIFDGTDNRFAKTPKLFPALPGIARGASLLSPQIFIEFDQRNDKGNTTKGVYANLMASSNDSVGKDDFGFVNLKLDARGYLPLGTPRRVLAARLIGNFNNEKGGSHIPFFRLARLGDAQTLRGYRPFRFYGRNALAANLEYRFELIPGIGALAFTDVGQVFDRRAQLSAQGLHATWGGGVEFKSKKSTMFRILVGKSGEGTRLIFGFGQTF
ncbi:MAG: BamA/TamA family outer membrane protein [Acidobacteria bacterium]|nr:BamA/TamA family outer membrane protein [Acidobacteriota bacterium]